MKVLNVIWGFLNSKVFGYVLIGITLFFLLGTCGRISDLKEEDKKKEQNISALTDSIKTVVKKNGDLEVSIDGYVATAKELKDFNERLSEQVKQQKGKVITLNNIVFRLKQDSTDLANALDDLKAKYGDPEKVNDSTYNFPWTLPYVYDSTNYDIFTGKTQVGLRGQYDPNKIILTHNKTWGVNRESQVGLTWGQKYVDGKLKVYATTSHPGFKAKLLEGVYVDYPEKQHWLTGFGVGPQFGVGYDFLNNQPAFTIGIGIQYNIFQW